MRIPEAPPDFAIITKKIVTESVQRFTDLISLGLGPDHNGLMNDKAFSQPTTYIIHVLISLSFF